MVPFDRSGLDRLSIHRYRAVLDADEPIRVAPDRLPNVLRGSFDIAFRHLVCHDIDLDCRRCPLLTTCPYPVVFRPAPPPGSERLSRQQDIPRPFLFEPPAVGDGETSLEVGLTLFGAANRFLPYFVVALRALADRGFGRVRGRLRLARVSGETPGGRGEVFDQTRAVVTPFARGLRVADLDRPMDEATKRVRVRFLTPTTLKRDGLLIERPSFADLVCRVRDRLSSLAAFFGDGPLEMDFAGVGRAAGEIRTVECQTRWERRNRRSSRTGDVHEISGFVGEAVYEGELGGWMPLLRLGEAVHVGKYAVWGNGRMAVEGIGRCAREAPHDA